MKITYVTIIRRSSLYQYRYSVKPHTCCTYTFLCHFDIWLVAHRIYWTGLCRSAVSLVIRAIVTVIVATLAGCKDDGEVHLHRSREIRDLARYAPSVPDSTRVNFALTFSLSCTLRITRCGKCRRNLKAAASKLRSREYHA